MPLYVDDWMNNNKLKLCSPGAHGLMISIMCLMHKSEEYGVILLKQKYKQSDKQRQNFASQIAKLTSFDFLEIENYFYELLDENVLEIDGEKLICWRMFKDGKTSRNRSFSGKKGGSKTQSNIKNFAKAKTEANTVNENGIVNEYESETNNKKVSLEKKITIPELQEFISYAIEKDPLLDEEHLKLKYDAWKIAGWKNGNDKPIKNWKSALNNTIPFIKKKNVAPAGSVKEQPLFGRMTQSDIEENSKGW